MMKTLSPFVLGAFALAAHLAFAGSALAAGDDAHDHAHEDAPLHGGVVAEAGHLVYELVTAPETVRLYLRDHGKALATEGGQARLTVLDGKARREIALQPAGTHFEGAAGGAFAAGAKAVAVVQRAGKPSATVRFVLR